MKKRILSAAAGASLVLAMGACVTNLSTITVLGISMPDETCVISPSGTMASEVLIDINVARRGMAGVIARNDMTPSLDLLSHRTELRTMLVEGAFLKYKTGTFTKPADRYVQAIGSIAPGGGTSALPVEIFSSRDIDTLRGDTRLRTLLNQGQTVSISVNLKLDGRITDGGRMQSSEISLPVRLCAGCLELPPTTSIVANPTFCQMPPAAVKACVYGQDVALEYCQYESIRR